MNWETKQEISKARLALYELHSKLCERNQEDRLSDGRTVGAHREEVWRQLVKGQTMISSRKEYDKETDTTTLTIVWE